MTDRGAKAARGALAAVIAICLVGALVAIPVVRRHRDDGGSRAGAGASAGAPGPSRPPAPGRYGYRRSAGEGDAVTEVEVAQQGRAAGETRQTQTADLAGVALVDEVSWRAGGGKRVLRSTLTTGPVAGRCDWQPDLVELPGRLRRGSTWKSTSVCAISALGFTVNVTRTISARVLDAGRASMPDGSTVAVWVLDRTDRIEAAGEVVERRATVRFAPALGLDVSEEGAVTSSRGGRQVYRSELVALPSG